MQELLPHPSHGEVAFNGNLELQAQLQTCPKCGSEHYRDSAA